MFRHEPTGADGEIAGHLHPVARVSGARPHASAGAASRATAGAW